MSLIHYLISIFLGISPRIITRIHSEIKHTSHISTGNRNPQIGMADASKPNQIIHFVSDDQDSEYGGSIMDPRTRLNHHKVSKYAQERPNGEKNYLPAQLGAIAAVIAALIAISAHLFPQVNILPHGIQPLSALGIQAVFTTGNQVVYFLIAAAAFLVVSLIKSIIKGIPALDEISWPVVILDTVFDGLYVATAYVHSLGLFLAALGVMIAIDAIILDRDYFDIRYIIAFDVVEALTYGGLTLLFLNLVVLMH